MSNTICLGANTLCDGGGGHRWVFLNWALGLRALGFRVIWLEWVPGDVPAPELEDRIKTLKADLAPYQPAESVALFNPTPELAYLPAATGCKDMEEAYSADLLVNLSYEGLPREVVARFRRSALVDLDPGLTQIWMVEGGMKVPPHNYYFTIGETVGQPNAHFPDCGLKWRYTPPPLHLPAWPVVAAHPSAPFTTVTNWRPGYVTFQNQTYPNGKREGFLPFLDLPGRSKEPLELAVCLGHDDIEEKEMLHQKGWRTRDGWWTTRAPWDYQAYIQASRGEFSCVKPSCVKLQNAWISDRTLCYLASGKPAVVQHTGPSQILPDAAGLFRFQTLDEAVQKLEMVTADYERQCKLARALAEEYFDAAKVLKRVLETALS